MAAHYCFCRIDRYSEGKLTVSHWPSFKILHANDVVAVTARASYWVSLPVPSPPFSLPSIKQAEYWTLVRWCHSTESKAVSSNPLWSCHSLHGCACMPTCPLSINLTGLPVTQTASQGICFCSSCCLERSSPNIHRAYSLPLNITFSLRSFFTTPFNLIITPTSSLLLRSSSNTIYFLFLSVPLQWKLEGRDFLPGLLTAVSLMPKIKPGT